MKSNKFHFYYSIQKKNIENFTLLDFATGEMGNKGIQGNEGHVGLYGPSGGKGAQGDVGDKGNIGIRGLIGSKGPKGDKGIVGIAGRDGKRGIRGQRGLIGPPGPPGDPGPIGPTGFRGLQGKRGPKGGPGLSGKKGEKGYDGHVSINYSKCKFAGGGLGKNGWNYNHSNRGRAGNWDKVSTIQCDAGYVAVELETECFCYGMNGSYEPTGSTPFEICNGPIAPPGLPLGISDNINKMNNWGMHHQRDCKHRLTCCPLGIYDYPESVKLKRKRLNLRYGPFEEERIYNIMWISMEPHGFPKSLTDYPEIFNTKIDYSEDSIKSGSNNNINSLLVLPKDQKYTEIPTTEDCDSKRCNILNQVCSGGKICLNKTNQQIGCKRPPCWHTIPSKTENCQKGKCTDIGQLCDRDGGRICTDYPNIDDGCENPPCWNRIPILNDCEGKRCAYEGQQCSGGTHNFNFPGFVCLNKRNDDYATAPCSKPPCWHKIENETNECSGNKCQFVGQKCRVGGTDDFPIQKICLDKTNSMCNNPPCWFNIPKVENCNKEGMTCKEVESDNIKPLDTMIYSSTNPILIKNNTNNISFFYADALFKNHDDLIKRLLIDFERLNSTKIIIIEWMENKNWSHLNTFVADTSKFENKPTDVDIKEGNEEEDEEEEEIVPTEIKKNGIIITDFEELFLPSDIIEIVGIVKFKNAKTKITDFTKSKINTVNTYFLRKTTTEYDDKKLKLLGFSENSTLIRFSMDDDDWTNLSKKGIQISKGKLMSKYFRQKCERVKCEQIEAKDDAGNVMKDDIGNPILVPGPCAYHGSCGYPGQKCRSDSTYSKDMKEWVGGIQKECVNSYRQVDTLPSSVFDPETCLKKPCWMDINNDLDPYFWAKPINNHSENAEGTLVKPDNKINSFKTIRSSQEVSEVYKFQPEDKEGYITKSKLLEFMTQNWMIFEANVLNIDTLWAKYSSNNRLEYGTFSAMMRVLNVETFKFRNDKRIIPRVMNEEEINTYTSRFGVDLLGPFRDRTCKTDKECPGSRCGCSCPFGCVGNCCKDIFGNIDKNNCPSRKCIY